MAEELKKAEQSVATIASDVIENDRKLVQLDREIKFTGENIKSGESAISDSLELYNKAKASLK